MIRLDEVFDILLGQSLELINCEEINNGILFISRTSSNNGVATRIKKLENLDPMPQHAITVALGGSVLSSFYQSEPFYTAFHIACLYPKEKLSEVEMLYYCYIIEQNKYRYNYGRQANRTLKEILVPSYEELPYYINKVNTLPSFNKTPIFSNKISNNTENWKWFVVENLFEQLKKCKCSNASEFLQEGYDIAYIGAKKSENGIMRYVKYNQSLVTEGNCIVFIGDGQGSVGFTTYQPLDFIGSTTLTAGYNSKLNSFNALFLVSIFDMERYRYSFGRKYGYNIVKKSKIKLPTTKMGEPDWEFMENYIKSLPYSACL